MKRTEYAIAWKQTSTATIYRSVITDGNRFYVKDNGRLWDVTDWKDDFRKKQLVIAK